jgi:hypothetical protein
MKAPAYFLPLFLTLFFVPSTAFTGVLHAQAPAAGASVSVKMLDTVNSGSDPAGKQYRASVTKAVDAGNGLMIPQGAVAAVTLAKGGTGWTTQLASVTINGQVVAVNSGSASVTSSAQSAAASAMSSVSSMLGGFGHHVNAPSGVTAVAMGQRVVLPPGITLTFVLTQPPAGSTAPPPLTASANPPPSPASAPVAAPGPVASAGGPLTEMLICFSNPPPNASDLNHKTEFLTGVFEIPADARSNVPPNTAFEEYLKTAYQYPGAHATCQPIWSVADARAVQKKLATDHAPNLKMVDTGWRYGQPPLAQGQSGFDPLKQGPEGLDLSQHRLTTYYCSLLAPGGTTMAVDNTKTNWNANMTTYVSPVFQADWDGDPVSTAYTVFIRDHYVHDLDPTANTGPRCSAQSPAMQAMQHQSAMISGIGHVVPVDFTDTVAQAAASHAAAASANTASAGAGPALGPNRSPAFCYSDLNAPVVYLSDIFAIQALPVGSEHGNGGAQRAAEYANATPFQAFLKKQYGSNSAASCSISFYPTAAGLKAAQDSKQRVKDMAIKSKGQIVETGWKNQ